MNPRTGILIVIGLAVIAMIGGVLPVQILYASSGSMEPVISEGDLYVVVDAGDVQPGDIIAFESDYYNEYVTHRVVEQTDEGYLTQGDANPSTDQEGGHPPVSERSVVGEVVTVAGAPITIGGVGPVIGVLQSYRIAILLGIVAIVFLPELLSTRGMPDRPARRVTRVGGVLHPLFLIAVVGGFFVIYWGSSSHDLTYVATAGQATAAHTVPVGESVVRELTLETYVPPLTTTVVDADGVRVIERSVHGSTAALTVQVPARTTTGPIRAHFAVNAYPATLPRSVLTALDEIHWLVAAAGSMLPIFGPVFGLYFLYVDPDVPLRWPRNRWVRSKVVK